MKICVAILALIALVVAQENGDQYTTKYDSVDLDGILKSDRLFKSYYNCLMEDGACTPEGNYLKRVLPEALDTNCAKCSEKQREDGNRAIKYLSENRAEEWKVLRAKFDPEHKLAEKFADEAEKEGIAL